MGHAFHLGGCSAHFANSGHKEPLQLPEREERATQIQLSTQVGDVNADPAS